MIGTDTPFGVIREAVASSEGVAPSDLPPIEDDLSRSELAELPVSWGDLNEDVTFTYVWYRVTLYPSGEVIVEP